jgi:hypothetical protein
MFVLLAGCAGSIAPAPAGAASVAAAPVVGLPSIGTARVWVYREYEPSEGLARPYVRFNGQIVGISEPGGSFYRDVQPGAYRVTTDSTGKDVNQFADVTLAPGQTVFIKVEVSRLWESDLSYTADTFYTQVIPPEMAQKELAHSQFFGGG